MPKFKNISHQKLTIPGVGSVEAGQTVELPENFHNANFERVKIVESKDTKIKEK